VVVENEGLVKWVLNQFVNRICSGGNADSRYFGYAREDMFAELLPAAYESALIAVESFDPSKGYTLSTYAEKVMWRDLTDEIVRWRSNTGTSDGDLSIEELLVQEHDQANGGDDRHNPAVNEVLEATSVDPFDAIDDVLDSQDTVARVQDALTDREFAALALTAEGFVPKEIARRLSVSEGNARVILHRARQKAQAVLA